MCFSGPKLGHTLLTNVPKYDSVENSSNTSNSDQEYPGLQIQNLRTALERGQMNTSVGNMNTDIQNFYHKLKEIQRNQPTPAATPAPVEKPKSSFSIDSLAKSSKTSDGCCGGAQSHDHSHHAQMSAASFNAQHQELYRKALENLHTAQRMQHVPQHGINQIMGMRQNMFPTQQHLLQHANLARMQAQRQTAQPQEQKTAIGSARKLSSSIVREAKNQLKGLDPENMYIECPLCHKRIKRLYHFQRHMRIHSGEKSHQCPYCPYKSVRKDNLKSHLKTHEKHALEARRNAEMLDKKRTSDIEAIRRLQFNAMKMAAGVIPPQMNQVAPPTRHHPYMHARPQMHQPAAAVPMAIDSCKEEPCAAEITEIDSGCESPQEQASPMRQHCQSDTSGIESGHSERHSSKESDSSFTNEDGEDRIIDVTK